MFFFMSMFLLIFNIFDDCIFCILYCYTLYILIYTLLDDKNFIFFSNLSKKINNKQYFFKNKFYRLFLIIQCFFKQSKRLLFWKPLFKKTSYYGFYVSNANNINKK